MNGTINLIRTTRYSLIHGNEAEGLKSIVGQDPQQDYLLFEAPCNLPDGIICTGLQMLINEYVR